MLTADRHRHAGFIAVHLGAGKHSTSKEELVRKLCASTCQQVAALLAEGMEALEAVCRAAVLLEDSPLTNAGFGSTLNVDGAVECDAAVMVSQRAGGRPPRFGAVSALRGVRNPILVAKEVVQYQSEPRLVGRVPPCVLVGSGALEFAVQRGLSRVDEDSMVSDSALARYRKYRARLEQSLQQTTPVLEIHIAPPQNQDTIGVICIDMEGNMACASSSGGIALKLPGRMGQVPMYGCGCWSRHSRGYGVAVATSGCGEQLIATTLARSVGEAVLDAGAAAATAPAPDLTSLMRRHFIDSDLLGTDDQVRQAGLMLALYDGGSVDFSLAFTTDSMVVGLMSTGQRKAKVRVSRNSAQVRDDTATPLTVEGFLIKL